MASPRPPRSGAAALLVTLLALASCAPARESEGGRVPVVVIMIDTLRADRLGCYGFDTSATPALTALASEGAVFRNALAASPWTGPSVSALLTGKYPDEIGIHSLFDPLPASVPTLAVRLARRGYATGAVVSNAFAGPAYGHDKGYDHFHFERYKGALEGESDRPIFTADQVTDRALEWLRDIEGKAAPFFLYVHYTDPHEPYLPPAPWRDRLLAGRRALPEELLLDRAFTRVPLTADQLDAVRAQYQAEIAFTDHEIGRLLDALPANALVVAVGDHGEEFQEHGGFLHGHSLFQELLHVPLLLRGPGIPAGVTIDAPVSHVDIVPTVLERTGLASFEGNTAGGWGELSGRSLTRYFETESSPPEEDPRPLFSVLERGENKVYAIARGSWKLIFRADTRAAVLFDLDRDPGETRNVAPQSPGVVESLLELHQDRLGRIVRSAGDEPDPATRAAREAELRAIGYVK